MKNYSKRFKVLLFRVRVVFFNCARGAAQAIAS